MTKTTFGVLKVGTKFWWLGTQYVKTHPADFPEYRGRYGWVNCVGPAMYEGDTGHRFVDADAEVTPIE